MSFYTGKQITVCGYRRWRSKFSYCTFIRQGHLFTFASDTNKTVCL